MLCSGAPQVPQAVPQVPQLLPMSQPHSLLCLHARTRNGSATAPLKCRVESGIAEWQKAGEGKAGLIFSGAHPGDGLRSVSEANAMLKHALEVYGQGSDMPARWAMRIIGAST